MFKKIFATISDKDFYRFKDRAREEGLNLGEAFSSIAILYSKGAKFVIMKGEEKKLKKALIENTYMKDHNMEEENGKTDNAKSDQ